MAGAVALAFALPQSGQGQNIPASSTPSQAIPDAPKPQSPAIGVVTPGVGSSSTSATAPLPDDPDQAAVPTALPGSKPGAPMVDNDPVPDLPGSGQAGEAISRLTLVSNFVDVPFTVKDSKGNLVPGLNWRDVRVYENGVRQSPKVFTVDPIPLSVALVIDESMPHDSMTRVNNALGALQTAFTPYDEVSVFSYNNSPRMWTTFTGGQSPRLFAAVEQSKSTGRDALYYNAGEALSRGIDINNGAQDHINPLTAGGPGSPQGLSQQQVPREAHTLNDAILTAAEALVHVGPDRRRVIYVISDGKEFGSKAKTKEVIKYLQQNRIAVYATLTGDSSVEGLGFVDRIHLPLLMRDNILPVYTSTTGGQYYAEYRQKGIETSFAKITEQVRTQYTIGYYSREPFIDGKYRTIEVRVLRPNLEVIAKKGYYPTAQAVRPAVRAGAGTTQ